MNILSISSRIGCCNWRIKIITIKHLLLCSFSPFHGRSKVTTLFSKYSNGKYSRPCFITQAIIMYKVIVYLVSNFLMKL